MLFGFGKRTTPNTGPSKTPSPNNKTLKNKANAARKAALTQLNIYKSKAAATRKGGRSNKRR